LPVETFGNHPVNYVTWDGAQAFCKWHGGRLPTEAEWEYAAKGGNLNSEYVYSGSNDPDSVAWFTLNSENKLHSVGQKYPNEIEMNDLSGNIKEWCFDYYGIYSQKVSYTDPTGPASGNRKVVRGGSYSSARSYLRVTHRELYSPGTTSGEIGFRLCIPQ
jgi:formylglycine-generating enzyme required for sulfatase activity